MCIRDRYVAIVCPNTVNIIINISDILRAAVCATIMFCPSLLIAVCRDVYKRQVFDPRTDTDLDALQKRADQNMYENKKQLKTFSYRLGSACSLSLIHISYRNTLYYGRFQTASLSFYYNIFMVNIPYSQ